MGTFTRHILYCCGHRGDNYVENDETLADGTFQTRNGVTHEKEGGVGVGRPGGQGANLCNDLYMASVNGLQVVSEGLDVSSIASVCQRHEVYVKTACDILYRPLVSWSQKWQTGLHNSPAVLHLCACDTQIYI